MGSKDTKQKNSSLRKKVYFSLILNKFRKLIQDTCPMIGVPSLLSIWICHSRKLHRTFMLTLPWPQLVTWLPLMAGSGGKWSFYSNESSHKSGKEMGEWLLGGGRALVVLATELTIILLFRRGTVAQREANLLKVTQVICGRAKSWTTVCLILSHWAIEISIKRYRWEFPGTGETHRDTPPNHQLQGLDFICRASNQSHFDNWIQIPRKKLFLVVAVTNS